MEEYDIKQEYKDECGETIYNHRNYEIKNEKNGYILLRLEIDENNIYIIISLNNNIEYNYKTKMSLPTIVNKLELNPIKYSNLELILNIFDEIYKNKNIFIKINNDESCILLIKFINVLKESEYEFKLYKNYTKINDKFNILFNEVNLLKNKAFYNNEMNNTIKNLNNKIEELEEIINNKDILINEMNNKILTQESRIKDLERRRNENEIKLMKEKITNIENIINSNQLMDKTECIKDLNNKTEEDDNDINNNNNIISDYIKGVNKEIINKNEDKNKLLEYEQKVNYKFIKDPKNLKFKENIITTNTCYGWNDIFEIFTSYKDKLEYLASPNLNSGFFYSSYEITIFKLLDNQQIISLSGHNNKIRTIRYFINDKNKNEYLISADDDKRVIIWDITNDYNIKCNIDTKYGENIYSCLLVFPNNIIDNYIITSSFNRSENDEESSTKIYLLNDEGKFFKYINKSNKIAIYYLLSWYNKKNKNYYIIQFAFGKIIINNLLEDELYSELVHEHEDDHYSGFICYKNDTDYLYSSSRNGYINIWDLYNKNIFKVINTKGSKLSHIIEWNNKYVITVDFYKKLIKIIDVENDIITDIKSDHTDRLPCIKKINHPIYGESLLSAANDNMIKLWTIG